MEKLTIYADENRDEVITAIKNGLGEHFELLQVAQAEYSIPCVDSLGTEFYINVKIIVKGQNREGEFYDGHAESEDFYLRQKIKAEKAAERERKSQAKKAEAEAKKAAAKKAEAEVKKAE